MIIFTTVDINIAIVGIIAVSTLIIIVFMSTDTGMPTNKIFFMNSDMRASLTTYRLYAPWQLGRLLNVDYEKTNNLGLLRKDDWTDELVSGCTVKLFSAGV